MAVALNELLKKIPEDTEYRVDQTRKRIGNSVREAIRRETGLILSGKDPGRPGRKRNISVPVKLVAGLPVRLLDFTFDDDYWLVLTISPYRRKLQQVKDGCEGLVDLIESLTTSEAGQRILRGRELHVSPTHQLVSELMDLLDREDPVKRILAVDEDVLGCYRYIVPTGLFQENHRDGTIELYWGVIGLIAQMLGISIEALASVVLIHELGHAYTHCGADIDGERWSSKTFSEADHELKEGLAQYYTELVCERLGDPFREIALAYKELLEHQPPAYHTHCSWSEFSPEEVRLAMLEIRRQGPGHLEFFSKALEHASVRLRRKH